MTFEISRRAILNGASCAIAMGSAAMARPAHAEHEMLHEFSYEDVKLTRGPLAEHYNWIHAHYLSLDNDRLLKAYRQHAGMDAPGKDMGGWYDPSGFVPGHTLGQYISGLARFGRSTGDSACHAKVAMLVDGFAKVLARNSNPYAGPSSEKLWAAYVYDKHAIGLIDAYRFSDVKIAGELLPRVYEGAKPFISPESRDRIGKKDPPYDETYVLSENLFAAAGVTGDRHYRTLAVHYLLNKEFFDPLANGEDVLPGKHAYSHAIALSSAASAYLALGDTKYKKALINAWRFLEAQRYASGGWGPEEQFVTLHQGALYESLFSTKAHFETPCGAYANIKLARYLLRFTGDAQYGDGLERDIYNTILATRRPDDDGDYPYYSTYSAAAQKEYYPHKWPCCSGTLAQCVADYPLDVYFHAANKLYVNLYTPSEVRWTLQDQEIHLEQDTEFPSTDTVTLRLTMTRPARFGLNLRIPGWIASVPHIRINGRPFKTNATPRSFAAIERMWKNGDVVELTLPQNLRTIPIDDKHTDTVALMNGPVMYVAAAAGQRAIDPPAELKALPQTPDGSPMPINGSLLVPYYLVTNETYDTYFRTT